MSNGYVNQRGIFAGVLWALFQLGVLISFVATHSQGVTVASVTSAVLLCIGACCSGAALALKTQRKTDTGLTLAIGVLMVLELICAGVALAASYIPDALAVWDSHLSILAVFNVIFGVAALAVVTITDNTAKEWADHAADKARAEMAAEIAAFHSSEGRAVMLQKYLGEIQANARDHAPRAGLRIPLTVPQQQGGNEKHADAAPPASFK